MREILLALLYFLLAWGAMLISRETGSIAAFWPPNAVAIGVLCRFGNLSLWRAILFCGVANTAANMAIGNVVPFAVCLAFANMLQVLGGTLFSRGFALHYFRLWPSTGFVLGFMGMTFGPVLISSLLGSLAVVHFQGADFSSVFFRWWAADMAGLLFFFSPLVLYKRSYITSLTKPKLAELGVLVLGLCVLHFSYPIKSGVIPAEALIPMFLWCAFRFNPFILSVFATTSVFFETFDILFLMTGNFLADHETTILIQKSQFVVFSTVFMSRVICHTIESMHRSQAVIQDKAEQLTRTNEDMSTLLHIVSHDLKSPLMTIQGFAGLLNLYIDNDQKEKAEHAAGRIQDGARTLASLIDDTLELSRMKRNKFANRSLQLSDMVHDVKRLLATKIEEKQATVVIEGETSPFFGDRPKIMRAIMNLVVNALNYGCPEPGMKITIGMQVNDGLTKFYVRDEGPGISPEIQERIFELFYRGESNGKGTGAGLAIVKKAAERHGGHVWVQSKPSEGATFWFSIVKRPDEPEEPEPSLEGLHGA